MTYRVLIGSTTTRFKSTELEARGDYNSVPFIVETIEEARQLVAMSKSPAWIIEQVTDGTWLGTEIEVSPLELRTQELRKAAKEQAQAARLETMKRINEQPRIVTKTYANIAVTFTRADMDKYAIQRSFPSAHVRASAKDQELHVGGYLTSTGSIQKAKWRSMEWVKRHGLESLADHLKDINAVANALSTGNYKEEQAK